MIGGQAATDSTRRRFLGTSATLGATAAAGCTGILDDGGDGDGGDVSWTEWVPAEFLDTEGVSEASRIDADRYREEFPAEMRASADLDDVEAQLGLSEGSLDRLLQIDENLSNSHVVFLGDVDPDDVMDHLGADATSSYEGYEVIGGSIALADGVLVSSPEYQTIVDAQAGDDASLLQADGEWPAAARNASQAPVGSVEAAPDDPWEVEAIAASGTDGDGMRITAYAHFESAEAAEANVDAVRNRAGHTGSDANGNVEDVSVEGNVVVLVATTSDYEF